MIDCPLASVILPAYNAAPYLPRCLDSLLAQTARKALGIPGSLVLLLSVGSGVFCGSLSGRFICFPTVTAGSVFVASCTVVG